MVTCTRREAMICAAAGMSLLGTRSAAQTKPEIGAGKAAAVERLPEAWSGSDGPGAAVTVTLEGARVLSQGFGAADLEHAVPISPCTVFPVASISKHFTAYAILLLA